MLTAIAETRMKATTATHHQSMRAFGSASFWIGEWRCCCSDERLQHLERVHSGDPHHRGRRVAHHAARAAGVRGRDDRREVAHVQLVAKHRVRDRTADHCRGDVVQEAR
jgi:hypothetical protein